MKVTRSAKKSAPTPGKVKRPLSASHLLLSQENTIPSNSTKLLITNLDHNVADSDICELFSEFGTIREVAVHYNCWGYSLGTAHVVFLNHENAAEAARRYNGVPFDGRPMTITLEGAPHGALNVRNNLPVKMRLSFGPNHNGRNPLSQVNVPTRGRPPKGVKRLENGPKGFGGLVKPRGQPAVLGNGKSLGRLPTAAELDMELDEYLSQKRKKHVSAEGKENDDFGNVNELPFVGGVTPYKSAKKKTPKGTPKTPAASKGKTPKGTPARRIKNSPVGTSTETPKRTPGRPRKNSPSATSPKTPKRTPGRPAKASPKGTPGNRPTTTPFKVKLVRVPAKTPKKDVEETSVTVASETLAAAEEVAETLAVEVVSKTLAVEEVVSKTLAVEEVVSKTLAADDVPETMAEVEEVSETMAVEEVVSETLAVEDTSETLEVAKDKTEMEEAEEITVIETAPVIPESADTADEIEEVKQDIKEAVVPQTNRTLKTPAKAKVAAKNSGDTPSRRRTIRAASKTPSKVEPPKKRKAAVDETLEEADVLEIEADETLPELPDLSKSSKKLSKRRSGRFAGGAN